MYICKNAIIYGDLMAKKAEFYASSFYGKGREMTRWSKNNIHQKLKGSSKKRNSFLSLEESLSSKEMAP